MILIFFFQKYFAIDICDQELPALGVAPEDLVGAGGSSEGASDRTI